MALIIDRNSFANEFSSKRICFSGSGSAKFKTIITHTNAKYCLVVSDVSAMAALTDPLYSKKQFADLAYIEPLYLKEFYSPTR